MIELQDERNLGLNYDAIKKSACPMIEFICNKSLFLKFRILSPKAKNNNEDVFFLIFFRI